MKHGKKYAAGRRIGWLPMLFFLIGAAVLGILGYGAIRKFPEIAESMLTDFIQSIQLAPDGVVTEIYPETGNEAGKIDRPDAGSIPILAMTANAFAEDVQKCLDAGMNAHLAKPPEMERVERTICEQVARSARPGDAERKWR